jgi:membrane-anchored protein YejM (alkaline phosphatase superfamily)
MAVTRPTKPLTPFLLAWRECGWLYCGNGLLSVLFSLGYIASRSSDMQDLAAFCLPVAVVSYAFCLNLVPAAASAAFYFFLKRRWMARMASALLYASLQIALVADIILFRMFHRHFDKLTWLMLTSEGAGDTIIIGFWNWVIIAILALLLIAISCGLSFWLAPRTSRRSVGVMLALMAGCVLVDKEFFAYCDLKQPATVYWLREYLPLYPSVSLHGLGHRMGLAAGVNSAPAAGPPDGVVMDTTLDFPKKPIGFGPSARRPNILYLLVDSARSDALSAEVMPNVWRWKEEALWLTNHYSTGHVTREGVFGALYGLPGNYLRGAVEQRKGAPLLDALLGLNYDMDILSCADLAFPLCRASAFVRVTNRITDYWTCPREYRDMAMTDEFLRFIKKHAVPDKNEATPFFGFLFYDAAHLPYYCPKEYQLHPLDTAQPNPHYVKFLFSLADAKEAKDYYENGLHYIDIEIGRVIDELKAQNMYDNTIIILAGDHGEEFGEDGSFGHGNTFSPHETRPMCLVRFPGWAPGVCGRMTSSVDFVPSILTWMGATNAIKDYSTGCVLNENNDRTFVICSDPVRCALIQRDRITVYDKHLIEVFDGDYHAVKTADPQAGMEKAWLEASRQRSYYFK